MLETWLNFVLGKAAVDEDCAYAASFQQKYLETNKIPELLLG